MNTIKIFLAESGRVADLQKNFPLYQKQYQSKLLNVFVPTSILAPNYEIQHYIGRMSGNALPSNTTLNTFVTNNTSPSRSVQSGDIIEFILTDGVTTTFYQYVYGTQWTYTIVDRLLLTNVAGTSVKIGVNHTERNGKIKVSESRYMRYIKTLTIDGTEYALYERKLPREFTLYSGQGENAPKVVINVLNVEFDTPKPTVLDLITSQTCALDVMPSNILDEDEPIEPSELDELSAAVNELQAEVLLKQDKVDQLLETTDKSVVGGINELKGRVDTNQTNIETNTEDIADLREDVDEIIETYSTGLDYIGQLSGSGLPSDEELDEFVREETDPSRDPKNGDMIIYIQEILGGTDKNFQYIYGLDGWKGHEIPPMENAGNGTYGIIEGTYSIGETNDTLVDISGGKILNIYIKDTNNAYRNIVEYANSLNTSIANIIAGTQSVGQAIKALQDELGNNIVDTYLTKNAGATKSYVRAYALPRTFNDVYYISNQGYSKEVPTTPASGIQFTETSSSVGDLQLFQEEHTVDAEYELSSKNSCDNKIFVASNKNCYVSFRITTEAKKTGGSWITLGVELSNSISLVAGDIYGIELSTLFASLGNSVISLEDGDLIRQTFEVITQTSESITFDVYSNDIYPSKFTLTTQSLKVASGLLGEQPSFSLEGTLDSDNNIITFEFEDGTQLTDNVEGEFNLYYEGTIQPDTELQLKLDNETIRLVTPYNIASGNATYDNLKQVFITETSGIVALRFKGFIKLSSRIEVWVDEDDLTNYVDKTSNETISGIKTFSNGISLGGSGSSENKIVTVGSSINIGSTGGNTIDHYGRFEPKYDNAYSLGWSNRRYTTLFTNNISNGTNSITVEEIVDLQDEKLDKEVTQTSEDEETTVNLENNGQDFEVRITENGSVDRTFVIDKTGIKFIDNEAGEEIEPLINGKPIGGEIQPASKTVLGGVYLWTDENNKVHLSNEPLPVFDRVFGNNTWEQIHNASLDISSRGLTSAQVEEEFGWKLGDAKDVELSNGETIQLQIIGINHDTLSSDHTSKAGLTLQMKECLNTRYSMNSTHTNAGGWNGSNLRTTTLPTIKALLPQDLQNVIKLVDKKAADGGSTNYHETLTSSDDLFLLCEKEVAGTSSYAQDGANEGTQYEYWVGKSASDRIKHYGAEQTATGWWLRSSNSGDTGNFVSIHANGNVNTSSAINFRGLSWAICI